MVFLAFDSNNEIGIPWLKFIYSEKALKFCEILLLTACNVVKSKVKSWQNVAFSKYMNFKLAKQEGIWGWFSWSNFDSNRQWNWRNAGKSKSYRNSQELIIQYCACKTRRGVTMVFLAFDSKNEIEIPWLTLISVRGDTFISLSVLDHIL